MTEDRVLDSEASDTSSSLLVRIQANDSQSWERFVRLYTPLIYHWCRRWGVSEADSADIGQEVFGSVARGIGTYKHQKGSFRGWLRRIAFHKVSDLSRRPQPGLNGEGGSDVVGIIESFPDGYPQDSDDEPEKDELILLRQALEMVLVEFQEETRQAFFRVVIGQQSPVEVANELGMTSNSVYLAKARVLRRLKEEFSGLIESL